VRIKSFKCVLLLILIVAPLMCLYPPLLTSSASVEPNQTIIAYRVDSQLRKLSENIRREIEQKDESETTRVIIRLPPANLENVSEATVVGRLREHANRTQGFSTIARRKSVEQFLDCECDTR